MNFILSQLNSYITFKNGKKRPSKKGLIPVYGGNGILDYTNEFNHKDCVIIGRVGAYCGSVYLSLGKCWVSDNAIIAKNNSNADLKYIYYLLKFLRLNERHIGTGQPLLTQEILNNINTYIPTLEIQKKISAMLSSIDDNIYLNTRINNNLEQQAQMLFKSWFVDFEPFGGKMPEDWRIGSFSELIVDAVGGDWGKDTPLNNYTEEVYCIRGADIPEVKVGNKGKMPKRYILPKNYLSKKLKSGDLVVEISGGSPTQSTGRIAAISDYLLSRYDEKIICTNFCRAIQPKANYSEFIYHYWQYLYDKNIFFSYENGTTGIKNLDISGFLETEQINIPNQNILNIFSKVCKSFFKQIYTNGQVNEKLAQLRDALLPKLMSGEIDVSKVNVDDLVSADKLSFTEK